MQGLLQLIVATVADHRQSHVKFPFYGNGKIMMRDREAKTSKCEPCWSGAEKCRKIINARIRRKPPAAPKPFPTAAESANDDLDVLRVSSGNLLDNSISRYQSQFAHPSCSHKKAVAGISMARLDDDLSRLARNSLFDRHYLRFCDGYCLAKPTCRGILPEMRTARYTGLLRRNGQFP